MSNIEIKHIIKKIELSERAITILKTIIYEKDRLLSLLDKDCLEASNIYYYLNDKPNELLFVILLEREKDNRIARRIYNYLNVYKKTSIFISGYDLTEMGMKPSPIYAKILRLVFYLQLNGILKNRDDEISFVKELIRKRII